MNIHFVQHVPFEVSQHPRLIDRWRSHRRLHTSLRRDSFPRPDSVDLLIVMGDQWVCTTSISIPGSRPRRISARVIDAGNRVSAICLGAQLIADVLGRARVSQWQKEIGWFPAHAYSRGRKQSALRRLLRWSSWPITGAATPSSYRPTGASGAVAVPASPMHRRPHPGIASLSGDDAGEVRANSSNIVPMTWSMRRRFNSSDAMLADNAPFVNSIVDVACWMGDCQLKNSSIVIPDVA